MAPKWAAKMPKLSIRSSGLSVPNHNKSQRIVASRNDPRVLCFVAVCFASFFHTCAPQVLCKREFHAGDDSHVRNNQFQIDSEARDAPWR